MNNKDIAKEWFMFANNDLNSAEFLLNMKPLPLEIICYHCQQSAEINNFNILRTRKVGAYQ